MRPSVKPNESQFNLFTVSSAVILMFASLAWGDSVNRASSTSVAPSTPFVFDQKKVEFSAHDQYTCARQIQTHNGIGQDKIRVSYKISRNQEPDFIQVVHGKKTFRYIRPVESRPVNNDAYGLPVLFLTTIGKVAISAAVGRGTGQVLSKLLGSDLFIGILVGGSKEAVTLMISDSHRDIVPEQQLSEQRLNKSDWAFGIDYPADALGGYRRFVHQLGLVDSGVLAVQLCQLDKVKAAELLGFHRVP